MISQGMTRRAALAMSGAALVVGPSSGAAQGSAPSRACAAAGRNPDGSAYSGTVQITESGGAVSMAWQVGSGGYTRHRPARRACDHRQLGRRAPGGLLVMPNGELHGTWADGQALEKLTPGG